MRVQLGLKGSTDDSQYRDRLQYHPDVFEFFTQEDDFTTDGLQKLRYAIQAVQNEATSKIVLHQPMRYQKTIFTELIAPESRCPGLYKFVEQSTIDLLQVAYDFDVQVLISWRIFTANPLNILPCIRHLMLLRMRPSSGWIDSMKWAVIISCLKTVFHQFFIMVIRSLKIEF